MADENAYYIRASDTALETWAPNLKDRLKIEIQLMTFKR